MAICAHPTCHKIVKRNFCGRHWHELPEGMQDHFKHCESATEKKALLAEAIAWFEERMIGELEINTCRGRKPDYDGCGADIVWLLTSNGKNVPVNANRVQLGDRLYDRARHVPHWDTCPKTEKVRR